MSEEESFKVTDRRGRAKESPPAEPTTRPPAEPRPSSVDAPRGEPGTRGGPTAGAPDLQGLFVMFATSALINLGEAADTVSGERRVNLEQAREAIDILLLLRDKTSGNRTDQEDRVLEQILYDLQIRFVRAAERERPH